MVQDQIFYYTRWITPKRVTSWRGPSPRHCARATQLLSKKCRSGGSRWQHCVRFDRPEIWTSDLPLQRRTRYRSTNWPVWCKILTLTIKTLTEVRQNLTEVNLVREHEKTFWRINGLVPTNVFTGSSINECHTLGPRNFLVGHRLQDLSDITNSSWIT